jgi:hypothetical protein
LLPSLVVVQDRNIRPALLLPSLVKIPDVDSALLLPSLVVVQDRNIRPALLLPARVGCDRYTEFLSALLLPSLVNVLQLETALHFPSLVNVLQLETALHFAAHREERNGNNLMEFGPARSLTTLPERAKITDQAQGFNPALDLAVAFIARASRCLTVRVVDQPAPLIGGPATGRPHVNVARVSAVGPWTGRSEYFALSGPNDTFPSPIAGSKKGIG